MKRSALVSYFAAAVLALGAAPALAQENPPAGSPASGSPQGARPSGGGTSTGTAAPRGGGGSSAGSTSSSGSSMGSSSGSAAPRGGTGASMPGGGGGDFGRPRPSSPERRGADYAVPRGMSESGFMGRGATTSRAPSTTGDAASDRRAVPAYARPRDGRNVVGEAIDRRDAPRGGGGVTIIDNGNPWFYGGYWDPFYGPGRYGYYGYGSWYSGYGFGLGTFYDPWGYSYYSPYNYDDYGYTRSYSYSRGYRPVGNLQLKVDPREGQVYVDGYYAGEVDNFDGVFQRLALEAGPHKIEIRAEGFEPVTFDVMVTAGETVTYKGELKRR